MDLKIPGTTLLKALAGSNAYGLATEHSDEDFRGVFVAHKKDFFKLDFQKEVSDETNDQSYFELSKFSELLQKSNPTILEMLSYPEKNIREIHPSFNLFTSENWLSMRAKDSYMGYALSQVRKAYGLKKRINLPDEEKSLDHFDFMEIIKDGEVSSFKKFIKQNENLSVTPVMDDLNLYSLWKCADSSLTFDDKNGFSAFKKGEELVGYLRYRKSEYGKYLKEYKSYFKWKTDQENQEILISGGEYDGKFLMHAFRLLYTVKDIAEKGELILVRPEREFLLKVRNHEFQYGELINKSEDLIQEVREAFKKTDLPENIDEEKVKSISAEIRAAVYDS
jgi:hypothetical protein